VVSFDELGGGLHLLVDGRLKTLRFNEDGKVLILDILKAGDVFGEMALVVTDAAPIYAQALEAAVVETVPRFAVEEAMRNRPALALEIARVVGQRRNSLERRLESQVFQSVPQRLRELLLDLAERFGKERAEGTLIDIPLSQQDLGNLIGGSREIVSLTLSELRRRGVVFKDGRKIVVNVAELAHEESRK
jgi:CRP/FNR family transcriptional regulator